MTEPKVIRAAAQQRMSCSRCRKPWTHVEAHVTIYSVARRTSAAGRSGLAAFPLCEACFTLLETTEARMPFYEAGPYTDEQLAAIRAALDLELVPLLASGGRTQN